MTPTRRKIVRRTLLALAALFVAIQLVPVDRTNPPVETEVDAPPEVVAVLRQSCYDCHSNESRWPWYAYVAPASWLVADDVHGARRHMNFSTWNRYDAAHRADHREEVWDEVEHGDMPLPMYVFAHPSARLSDADRAALRAWSQGEGD